MSVPIRSHNRVRVQMPENENKQWVPVRVFDFKSIDYDYEYVLVLMGGDLGQDGGISPMELDGDTVHHVTPWNQPGRFGNYVKR